MESLFDLMLDAELFKDAFILFATSILLPSFDIYSDISLSYSLIFATYEPYCGLEAKNHYLYGSSMLIPIIAANLFTIPHWLKRENTWKKRLFTIPFLILQFWPQWQVLKVIKLMWQKDVRWREEKEQLEKEISSIEPFLESLPMVSTYVRSTNAMYQFTLGCQIEVQA